MYMAYYKNVGKKIDKYEQFDAIHATLSRVVYETREESEFEANWKKMIEDFQLQNNTRLSALFEDRQWWAPGFLKKTFWLGLTSTQ